MIKLVITILQRPLMWSFWIPGHTFLGCLHLCSSEIKSGSGKIGCLSLTLTGTYYLVECLVVVLFALIHGMLTHDQGFDGPLLMIDGTDNLL